MTGTMKIYTAKDLMKFRDRVNSGESDLSAVLMNDIDITVHDEKRSPVSWEPIGKNQHYPFRGVFDGNGYTISGLYISETNHDKTRNALFGRNEGTIQNLTVDGVVKGYCGVAGICAQNKGAILSSRNKCRVEGHAYVAGICSCNELGGTVRYCMNSGDIVCGNMSAGIVGFCYGTDRTSLTQITGCKNNGTILYMADTPYSYYALRDNDYKFNQICCGRVNISNKQNGKVTYRFDNTPAGHLFRYGDNNFDDSVYQTLLVHDVNNNYANKNGDTYLHLLCQNPKMKDCPDKLLRLVRLLATETDIDFCACNDYGKEAADFLIDSATGKITKGCGRVLKLIDSVKEKQEAEFEAECGPLLLR